MEKFIGVGMLTVVAVIALIAMGLLVVLAVEARLRMPVKFKTFDERDAVSDVAVWAQKQIGPGDPRRATLNILQINLNPWYGWWLLPYSRISARDLEVLAPFIDQFIAGRRPPLNLPAEYEDWGPAALSAFKARMKSEGLWPKTPESTGAVTL